jgi:S-adenosylmethionine hydrolase
MLVPASEPSHLYEWEWRLEGCGPMIVTSTDFGLDGPYLGQVKAVFHRLAPGVPIVDLMADAPVFDPRAAAYLLAALVEDFPPAIFFCVVDPGVGGERGAMVAEIDGRLFVAPENGLLEPVLRRGGVVRTWDIVWRPEHLSATFHGRDLFAPVAARLAAGHGPEACGCRPMAVPRHPDWPDDLAAVLYIDHYGNAITGLRADRISPRSRIEIAGLRLEPARTFSDRPPGTPFWYVNSSNLVEFAVNGGRADHLPGLTVGADFKVLAP